MRAAVTEEKSAPAVVKSPRQRAVFREAFVAKVMLAELEAYSLRVVKVPAPDPRFTGHGIRLVDEQNAEWYREFTAQYGKRRGVLSMRCSYCGSRHRRPTKKERAAGELTRRCPPRRREGRRERRKPDTSITRADTVRGLNELLRGRCRTEYAKRLREFITRRADLLARLL